MRILVSVITVAGVAAMVSGCVQNPPMPSAKELDEQAIQVIKSSFRDQGIATVDRLTQDTGQKACSTDHPTHDDLVAEIQKSALASVKWPAGGRYVGDWKEGEKIAQSGRGMTWTDKPGSANGGSCYNCHQLSKQELSFGTIGPSLYHYGKLRGVADPGNPESEPIVKYTWAKLWNSKAYAACSNMPRFGHAGLLDEEQIRHVMALLLDPKSPVNQ